MPWYIESSRLAPASMYCSFEVSAPAVAVVIVEDDMMMLDDSRRSLKMWRVGDENAQAKKEDAAAVDEEVDAKNAVSR